MQRCWLVALCWLAVGRADAQQQQDDSLRGALEAVSRRHRDISDAAGGNGGPPAYYVDRAALGRFRPVRPDDELSYYENRDGFQDGQPEDIGYGYQKSLAPHTAGIFEPIPVPSSELGAHEAFANNHLPRVTEKELEKLASDYLGSDIDNNRFVYKFPRNRFPPSSKRSIFRERDEGLFPEALQRLYLANQEAGPPADFEAGRPTLVPSSFRERYPSRPGSQNALALIRSFGGLDRDQEIGPEGEDDSDEYLTMLNSIWEKYKGSAPEGFDPEEITESDVEELIDYLGEKEDKKRQEHYGGYDFFNSPMAWNKRSKQKLDSPTNDGFFHALKFLSSDRDVLESMHDDDAPAEDSDEDVARLLMEQRPSRLAQGPLCGAGGQRCAPARRASGGRLYRKRWSDVGGFDERFPYKGVAKRFPVTKRSPSYFAGPPDNKSSPNLSEHAHPKPSGGADVDSTDPKVAQELDTIFSTSGAGGKEQDANRSASEPDPNEKDQNKTAAPESEKSGKAGEESAESDEGGEQGKPPPAEHKHTLHRRDKDAGQKEEASEESAEEDSASGRPLEVKKKSIDWSDYFGIDRRRKKSAADANVNDEWLLNQYLNAYTPNKHPADLAQLARARQYGNMVNTGADFELPPKKVPDDIDGKLRAMEDLIVEEALKYTGAHEGITDSKEVQKVKERVMSQLEAAYSLEKMRRALGEFKSSIASRKESGGSAGISTPKPEQKDDQKSKRVAIKKEKADLGYKEKKLEKKPQEDNEINYAAASKPRHPVPNGSYMQLHAREEEMCPVLSDIAGRCRQISIIAGDRGDIFLPLCTLHQICYLCGPETGTATPNGCDVSFLNEANSVCHDNASCRFAARRVLSAMRTLKGDPSPESCDWENNPCLARFLALANDR